MKRRRYRTTGWFLAMEPQLLVVCIVLLLALVASFIGAPRP